VHIAAEITGFVSNVANDDAAGVFIANKMGSFRFSRRFCELAKVPGHSFRTYCSMTPDHKNGLMRGDVYILDEESSDLIAAIYGVQFKKVPIRVLETLLFGRSSKGGKTKSGGGNAAGATLRKAAPTAAAKPKTKPANTSRGSAAAETIRSVLAKELGLDTVEEHVAFAELGLDSLMSIVILGSLRDQLPQDVDLPASFFQDYPTMADVRGFMARELGDGDVEVDDKEVEPEMPSKSKQKKRQGGNGSSAALSAVETMKTVLCTELGVTATDIEADNATFAELGLDSLMSIVILGSLRDQLPSQIDLPASFFLDYPTLAAVREFMVRELGEGSTGGEDNLDEEEDENDGANEEELVGDAGEASDEVSSAMQTTRRIVATELGIDESELKPDTQLAHLGLDSLMSLLIRASVMEALPFEVPSTMFVDCPTLNDIEKCYIDIIGPAKPATRPLPPAPVATAPATTRAPVAAPTPSSTVASVDVKPSKPICLIPCRGPNASKRPLFLFPDGSGNAAVYAALSDVGRPVYGVSSPFVKDSTHWTGGMEQLAKLYIQSMKIQQPRGPYIIGGKLASD
jgi:acyl carrier protein